MPGAGAVIKVLAVMHWTILALFWIATAAWAKGEPIDLIADPGFEQWEGAAAGWKRFPIRGSAKGEVRRDPGGRQGSGGLLETSETMDGWMQLSTPIRGGIESGRDYELRLWLKGDRFIHNAALLIHDGTDWFPNDLAAQGVNVDTEWAEQVMRFRAGTTEPRAHLGIRLVQEARLWVDDASLRPLAPEPPPAPGSVPGSVPGNLVRNGSFEAGLKGWAPERTVHASEEEAGAPHGKRVLRFHAYNGGSFSTFLMPVSPASRYTLSWSARAKEPASLRVLLRSGYAAGRPPGPETTWDGPETVALNQTWEVGTTWQRFTQTVELPPVPNGSFYLTWIPAGSTAFWLDGVQLEKGDRATPFAPHAAQEGHLALSREDGLFACGESISAVLEVWSETLPEPRGSYRLRLVDAWERVESERNLDLNPALGWHREVFALEVRKTGSFRAEVLRPDGTLLAEAVFAVLPRVELDAAASRIGIHVDFAAPGRAVAGGARWTKSWWLSWQNVEPEPGVWKWERNREVDAWRAAGLEILGVLGGPPQRVQDRPENALSWGWYPPKDLAAMKEYARRVVETYRDRIHVWEMMNEPNSGLHRGRESSPAAAYAKQWRALAEGVRAADPQAIILGGSITLEDAPERWLREIIAADAGLLDLCDGVSYHNYSSNPETIERHAFRLQEALRQLGRPKPVWDTEWSPVKTPAPFYRDAPRNLSLDSAPALRTAAMLVEGTVARIGAGIERSFLYNAYESPSMNRYEFDLLTELGGAPRPALAAQAVLARMIDRATFEQRECVEGRWTYHFRRPDGKRLLITWWHETKRDPRGVICPGKWTACDLMGNPVPAAPGSEFPVGQEPLYLVEAEP